MNRIKLINGNFPIFFGIRRKFFLIFLLCFMLPSLLIAVTITTMASRSIESKLISINVQALEQIGNNIGKQLDLINAIATSALSNDEILKGLQNYSRMDIRTKCDTETKMQTWLTGLISLYPEVSGFYLFDRHDNYFYAKGRSPTLNYKATQQEWYLRTLGADGASVVFGTHEQFHITRSPLMVFSVTRTLTDLISQRKVGVLMIEIPVDYFDKLFVNPDGRYSQLPENYILDENGMILYSGNRQQLLEPFPNRIIDDMNDEIGIVQSNLNGVSSFIVYYTLPETNWKILSVQSRSEILGSLDNAILWVVGMLCMVAVIFIFCLLYVNHRLIIPIQAMSKAIGKITSGCYDTGLETYHSNDEIGSLASGMTTMAARINELINKEFSARLLQREAQIAVLQNQINPHFFCNSLECVRGLALEKGDKQTADMIKALSSYMRYTIYESRDFVSLKEEIGHIRRYITIQNMRHSGKFQFICDIPESFLNIRVMKLMLQPLVENSIQHGLDGKTGVGIVSVVLYEDDDVLVITVSDNGFGMNIESINALNERLSSSQTNSPGDGEQKNIGVINVHNRIRLYFGEQFGLHYQAVNSGGIMVKVKIPKNTEDALSFRGDLK